MALGERGLRTNRQNEKERSEGGKRGEKFLDWKQTLLLLTLPGATGREDLTRKASVQDKKG